MPVNGYNIFNGFTKSHRWQWSSNPRYMAHTAIMMKTAFHTITLASNPPGVGTLTGGGVYEHGMNVTVNAVPSAGWAFQNWTLNGVVVSNSPNYSFPSRAIGTLVANFIDVAAPYITSVVVENQDNIRVNFSEPVQTADALTKSNYSLSGSGRGSLSTHPEDVEGITQSIYRLRWGFPYEMYNGGDIIITAINIRDLDGNPISTSSSGIHAGGGIGTPPVAGCRNIEVNLNAGGTATVLASDINWGSWDNRGTVSLLIDGGLNRVYSCGEVGVNNATLTVADAAGHTAHCVSQITVRDTSAPVVSCKTVFVQLSSSGIGTLDPRDTIQTYDDNCGVDFSQLSLSRNTFTCIDMGQWNDVTLNVIDPGGNSTSCIAQVGVSYSHPPTVICKNSVVELGPNGTAVIVPSDVDGGCSDGCGIQSMSVFPNTFSCADIGNKSVVLEVRNIVGIMRSCTATVTIRDNLPPSLSFPEVIVETECGEATVFPSAITNDNCGTVTVALTDTGGLDVQQGVPGSYVVEFTAQDRSGNTATDYLTVEVRDTIAPIVTVPGNNPQFVLRGDSSYVPPIASAWDSCDGVIPAILSDNGGLDVNVIGSYSLMYSAQDSEGNVGMNTLVVIVVADMPPVLSLIGNTQITVNCGSLYVDAGASAMDNEDGDISATIQVTGLPPANTPLAPGVWNVIYTVTDSAGQPAIPVSRTVTVLPDCTLMVNTLGPTIIVKRPGETVQFAVDVVGPIGPVGYQWYKLSSSKVRMPVGDGTDVLTLYSVDEADAGDYICEVWDLVTSAESDVFTLLVNEEIPVASITALILVSGFTALAGLFAVRRKA